MSLELEWLFPVTIWFLALPPNVLNRLRIVAEDGIKWDLGDMGEGEGAPTIKRGVTVTRICGATEHPVSVYPIGAMEGRS